LHGKSTEDRAVRRAVPALIAQCEGGADPYLRAAIALALRRISGPDAEAALASLAADPSIIVRRAVVLESQSEAAR
jgi:HEAT repeat protein